MKKTILFVCTGNYYRSRFAEEYFNHLASKYQLNWEASSKGLSKNMPSLNNPGPISVHTMEALKERGIKAHGINNYPRPIVQADFQTNDRILAMSELEHRPMLESRFPSYSHNVEYYEVGDLPLEAPKGAIQKIAKLVDGIVDEILNLKESSEISIAKA